MRGKARIVYIHWNVMHLNTLRRLPRWQFFGQTCSHVLREIVDVTLAKNARPLRAASTETHHRGQYLHISAYRHLDSLMLVFTVMPCSLVVSIF